MGYGVWGRAHSHTGAHEPHIWGRCVKTAKWGPPWPMLFLRRNSAFQLQENQRLRKNFYEIRFPRTRLGFCFAEWGAEASWQSRFSRPPDEVDRSGETILRCGVLAEESTKKERDKQNWRDKRKMRRFRTRASIFLAESTFAGTRPQTFP